MKFNKLYYVSSNLSIIKKNNEQVALEENILQCIKKRSKVSKYMNYRIDSNKEKKIFALKSQVY